MRVNAAESRPAEFPVDLPRYDAHARRLHWLTAALILIALPIGLCASFLVPGTPVRRALLEVHKSLGMTALVMLVSAPPYARPLGALVHLASRFAHLALYAIILIMPLTGYMFSAAGGYSLPWFGLFQWPRLLPLDTHIAHLGQMLHGWTAWVLYVLLAAHIGAVVWHRFVARDDVLARMWASPRARSGTTPPERAPATHL
jgi:cytochrome b561